MAPIHACRRVWHWECVCLSLALFSPFTTDPLDFRLPHFRVRKQDRIWIARSWLAPLCLPWYRTTETPSRALDFLNSFARWMYKKLQTPAPSSTESSISQISPRSAKTAATACQVINGCGFRDRPGHLRRKPFMARWVRDKPIVLLRPNTGRVNEKTARLRSRCGL